MSTFYSWQLSEGGRKVVSAPDSHSGSQANTSFILKFAAINPVGKCSNRNMLNHALAFKAPS